MTKAMFYTTHQMPLYNHELLVDEIILKKNKLNQKFLNYGAGKQLVMP
jgi:hypothetical protein